MQMSCYYYSENIIFLSSHKMLHSTYRWSLQSQTRAASPDDGGGKVGKVVKVADGVRPRLAPRVARVGQRVSRQRREGLPGLPAPTPASWGVCLSPGAALGFGGRSVKGTLPVRGCLGQLQSCRQYSSSFPEALVGLSYFVLSIIM